MALEVSKMAAPFPADSQPELLFATWVDQLPAARQLAQDLQPFVPPRCDACHPGPVFGLESNKHSRRRGDSPVAAAITASGEQPRVEGELLRLANGDLLEGGMGRIEQVIEFSWNDDARQREHR